MNKFYIYNFKDFLLALLHPIKYLKYLKSWDNMSKDTVNECWQSYIKNGWN